ncbi:MAG: preprotein translocase subunit SecG [Terriglobia bacterium]
MISVVIGVHIVVSVFLVIAVLLHSGKGGGLSSAFGGGMPSTFSGSTIMEKNLDRLTIALAVVFGITSIVLALLYK